MRTAPEETMSPFVVERPPKEEPPVKVEVPAPATVSTLPTEKEVVEAMGKIEASLVEVALKIFAERESVKTPAPVTPRAVPGVPVAMPTDPVKTEDPCPSTWITFPTLKLVLDATGKVLAVEEVAEKYGALMGPAAVTTPPRYDSPFWMAKRVPGVVVESPKFPPLEIVRSVEVPT